MLGASEDSVLNMILIQHLRDFLDHMADRRIPFYFLGLDQLGNAVVLFVIQIIEAQIFQFILDGTDT